MLLKNKVEINQWLKKYYIYDYELISDEKYGYVVNVNDNVDISSAELKNIEVKFNIVNGDFDCNGNYLTSLIGCPEIVNGEFYCSHNELESLVGCPKIIEGSFNCISNNLNILEINNLLLTEINSNYIQLYNNIKLGELQNITEFNEIKKILTIYKEKNDIINIVEVKNKSVIIEKINKI